MYEIENKEHLQQYRIEYRERNKKLIKSKKCAEKLCDVFNKFSLW